MTIALSGELDLASAEDLDRAIRTCEETDIGGIVIDLADVSFIDSSGLSALLEARKRIDGRLHFVPSRHEAVTRLLALTETDKILN
jgi:anti-sigma B factor antagonist